MYTQQKKQKLEQCDKIEMKRATLPSEEIKQKKHVFVSRIDRSRKYSIDVTGPSLFRPPTTTPTPPSLQGEQQQQQKKFQNVEHERL